MSIERDGMCCAVLFKGHRKEGCVLLFRLVYLIHGRWQCRIISFWKNYTRDHDITIQHWFLYASISNRISFILIFISKLHMRAKILMKRKMPTPKICLMQVNKNILIHGKFLRRRAWVIKIEISTIQIAEMNH